MADLTYLQDDYGNAVAQSCTGQSADVNIASGSVAVDNSIPGVSNGIVNLPARNGAPNNTTTTVYASSLIAAASAAKFYGMTGYNSKASGQFVQVHDSATLPAEGAIPKLVIAVAASSNFSIDYSTFGRAFVNGIVVCNSSTGPTKTIGSADCWFDVQTV